MRGHFCATHAPEFGERKKKYAKVAQQTPRFPERSAAAAANTRSTKKTKGDNRALRKEIFSRVDECMNGSTSMKCSQCGKESSSCEFLHYPTEMWWKMKVPDDAPVKVLRFDAELLGKTQFIFCGRECENE